MRPHPVDDQRAILGLLWLWVLLHYAGPSRGAPSPPRPAAPVSSPCQRKRSNAPTPFEGLTHKPPCAACAHDATPPHVPPPRRRDPMPPTHRRSRAIETARHGCPHAGGAYQGRLGVGTLRAHGHPSGGLWRQVSWRACQGDVLETHGTIWHGKRVAVELRGRVWACAAEGLGMRATARVGEDPNPRGTGWEAAAQLQACAAAFLCDVQVQQWQRAALYAVLREVTTGARSAAAASERLERSAAWGWTTIDPGEHTAGGHCGGTADSRDGPTRGASGRPGVGARRSPTGVTDGLKDSGTALRRHGGTWMQPARRQDPRPTPRWMPLQRGARRRCSTPHAGSVCR
jgi:hypothetical protein